MSGTCLPHIGQYILTWLRSTPSGIVISFIVPLLSDPDTEATPHVVKVIYILFRIQYNIIIGTGESPVPVTSLVVIHRNSIDQAFTCSISIKILHRIIRRDHDVSLILVRMIVLQQEDCRHRIDLSISHSLGQ